MFYGNNLAIIITLVMLIANDVLFKAAVVYGYGMHTDICTSARVQAVLKTQHQQMCRLTIEEYITQYPEQGTEGALRRFIKFFMQ